MKKGIDANESRDSGKFPGSHFDIFIDFLVPLLAVSAIVAATVLLLTGCDAKADVRVDAVVRASEFEEARIEIYANTAAVAASAAEEYCSGEFERIEEAVYTNAAAVAENAARECSSNEMARIEASVYANAEEIAQTAADETCSNRMERIDRALEGKADKTSLSNAVETLRGEIAAFTPPGYESVSNTAYAAASAANAANEAASAASGAAGSAYIAATNALGRAESAASAANAATDSASAAHTAATNAAGRVDAFDGRIAGATNALSRVAFSGAYADLAGAPDVSDFLTVESEIWISLTNRVAKLEYGLLNAGPHIKVDFDKQSGSGGTDEIYWRQSGGEDYLGAFYFDEDATEEVVDLKVDKPARSGYAFTGYYGAASNGYRYIDDSGFLVNDDDYGSIVLDNRMRRIPTNSTFTVYAQWDSLKTVTLKPNGGSGDNIIIYYSSKTTLWYGDTLAKNWVVEPIEPLPTREGYIFTGYWTATSGGNQYIDETGWIIKSPTNSTTLYAHWDEAQGGS